MPNTILYARFREDGSGYQLLSDHCRNVSSLAAAACAPLGLGSLGAFVGLLHDCHKASPQWQAYLCAKAQGAFEDRVNHAPQAARWIWRKYGQTAKELPQKLAAQIAAMAVYSHHNTLFDVLAPDGKATFFERMEGDDAEESLASFFEQVASLAELDEMFASAAREVASILNVLQAAAHRSVATGTNGGELRECDAFFKGLTARFVFSALIDADRYDAACFESGIQPEVDDPKDWQELVAAFEKNLSAQVAETVAEADTKITAARQSISEACRNFADHGPGVYRLYVPTGAGKSFSALRFALHHAKRHQKSRVIVIEPYLTVIDQIAQQYRSILGEHAGVVLEFHSNVTPGEDEPMERVLAERFDSKVVVTTLVQFLDALYAAKGSAARRMRAFADAVIVLDEIQAIPVKCVDLFNLAVRFLADVCRATVVLCTATQPALAFAEHPLLLDEPKDLVADFQEYFSLFKRTELLCPVDRSLSAEELAAFLRQIGKEEKSVLAVVNTKAAALSLFSQLSAEHGPFSKVFFLSTHMCPAHRLNTIGKIRDGLKEKENLAVVSTSLIEFGVDLSFDCVVRSLAGVPSIAQVAGRCNRHGEQVSKRVYIVRYAGERLAALREIEIGQSVTRFLLRYLANGQKPVSDLLSPDVIELYYRRFFATCSPFMGFKAETGVSNSTTLIELLGSNRTAKGYAKKKLEEGLLSQSFETANRQFCVIEDGTAGILVPYGDGKRIIEELGAPYLDVAGAKRLLREAQRYTVNVFEGKLKELMAKRCLNRLERVGAFALLEGLYDPVTGISSEVLLNPDEYIV